MVENQIHTPEGWVKLESIGNLGKIFNGLSGKTKADFGEGEPYIPYVNVFKNSCIDVNEFDLVRVKKGEHQNKVLYGDLIFTTSSETIEEVGMTSVYLDKANSFYLNSFCFCFRLNDFNTILPEFARYLFRSNTVRYSITLLGQGSTRYNLSKTRLLTELKILIPKSTIEQQSIADILSKTDQAITNTVALIAKYTRIKTGLMQDLLTKGIGNDEFELVPTDLKNIKARSNFHITTLKAITKVRQGYQIAISARKKEEGENRYIYITVQYLNIPKKYLEYIENPPADVISKYDDILFTRTGNTGQIVTDIVGVYHNNFFKVDFDKRLITKDYLLLFLQWKPVKDLILELAGTTTIPDLKHKDFYSIPIFFPKTLDEQNAITNSINKANEVIERYEKELTKLQSLKTGLMQDLLTGKVRVKKLIQEANGK